MNYILKSMNKAVVLSLLLAQVAPLVASEKVIGVERLKQVGNVSLKNEDDIVDYDLVSDKELQERLKKEAAEAPFVKKAKGFVEDKTVYDLRAMVAEARKETAIMQASKAELDKEWTFFKNELAKIKECIKKVQDGPLKFATELRSLDPAGPIIFAKDGINADLLVKLWRYELTMKDYQKRLRVFQAKIDSFNKTYNQRFNISDLIQDFLGTTRAEIKQVREALQSLFVSDDQKSLYDKAVLYDKARKDKLNK